MKKQNRWIQKVWIGLLILLPIGWNVFFPMDIGLSNLHSMPYVIVILFQAVIGGAALGLVSWICVLCVLLGSAVLQGVFPPPLVTDPVSRVVWGSLPFLCYLFGRHAEVLRNTQQSIKNRLRSIVRKNQRYHTLIQELQKVNSVLEERVAKQKDSLTLLYNQVHTIRSLNLEKAIHVLLETVQMYLQARKLTLWTLDPKLNQLRIESSIGWESEKERTEYLSLTDSIEGWVYRNSTIFTFRMLIQYENLKKIYQGRTVLAVPVHAGRKPYGVLSIEELPFERYNLYSERLLQIIVGLAEPFLEEILVYRQLANIEDVDEDTGIPYYSQFYNLAKKEVERTKELGSNLSIVVFELENFSELAQRFGKEKVKGSLKDVIDELTLFSDSRFSAFLYREEGQVVFLCPNLDQDGASLFCLESLERLNQREWKVGETQVNLAIVVGYATARIGAYDLEVLLKQVDHLLFLQKM